ncbi:hypothetical protein BJ944DRAFT_241073 [Cunninghamella echinulata]|nr:hypothetical protein BJ944DRAFT_241073 [Cunninghamella echinulata]
MDTSTATATTNTHDNHSFLESTDLLNYDLSSNQDMLMYSSFYSPCHPLDKQQQQQPSLSSSNSMPNFLGNTGDETNNANNSDNNDFSMNYANLNPSLEDLYMNHQATNPSSTPSYLQYLQQNSIPNNNSQKYMNAATGVGSTNATTNTNTDLATNKHSFDFNATPTTNLDLFDAKANNWMLDNLDMYMPVTDNNDSTDTNFNLSHLPYVNLNDVNSFVTETDAMKHNTNLQQQSLTFSSSSPTTAARNHMENRPLMGELSPATPSTNNSGMPSTPYTSSSSFMIQQRGSYDSNESMDEFSDSDTTASSQSWLLYPSSQDPIHGWRDPLTSNYTTSNPNSSFGLSTSLSTPILSLNHSKQQQRSNKSSIKKGSNNNRLKSRKSNPSIHHHHHHDPSSYFAPNQGLNLHYHHPHSHPQSMHRKKSMPTLYHSSSNIAPTNKTAKSMKRKELKRRESEPHSLNKLNQYHHHHSLDPQLYSPSIHHHHNTNLINSEALSHFLSRQTLTDHEDSSNPIKVDQVNDPFSNHEQHHQHSYQNYSTSSSLNNNNNNTHGDNTVQQQSSSSLSNPLPPPPPPPMKKGRNVDKACNHCKRSHLRCDNMRPCRRCISTGKTGCKDVMHKPRGRPKLHKN